MIGKPKSRLRLYATLCPSLWIFLNFLWTSLGLPWWLRRWKCLPTRRETRVLSLGREGPLEKEMATLFSTLSWKIQWMEEPGRLSSMGSQRVGHDWMTSLSLFTFMHWRRNGNPLQCSCLEKPRDGRAWWAAVYGVAQSRTWLSDFTMNLSSPFVSVHKGTCYSPCSKP